MAELPSTARVVVIGGGAVGASCLYHLALAGWTDCLLLEKNELTCGSTWHAAGNVPTFSSSWSIMNMQRYSVELYRGLGDARRLSDELSRHRIAAAGAFAQPHARVPARRRAWAATRAWRSRSSAPDEIRGRYPFIETHDLAGALWDPYDGDIDPAQLTQALAKGARDLGAKIVRFCPVTGVRREGGEWLVETPQGTVRCEYVVNAAGYRGARGRPDVRPRRADGGDVAPVHPVRGGAGGARMVRGRGRASCRCCATSTPRTISGRRSSASISGPTSATAGRTGSRRTTRCRTISSSSSGRTISTGWSSSSRTRWRACRRWARAGISRVINGPIPYMPDGNPQHRADAGRAERLRGLRLHLRHLPGGRRRQGAGRMGDRGRHRVGHVVLRPAPFYGLGRPGLLRSRRPRKSTATNTPCTFRATPGRRGGDRVSRPCTTGVAAPAAQMGAYNGWERALWFAGRATTRPRRRRRPGSAPARGSRASARSARRCATPCGVLDLPGFSRFKVEGDGAAEWLDGLIAGRMPRVGRIGLGYFADERGPDRHRDVDDAHREDADDADHGGRRRVARPGMAGAASAGGQRDRHRAT